MYPTIAAEDICLCFVKKGFSAPELHRGMIVLSKHKGFSFLLMKRIIAEERDLDEIRGHRTLVKGQTIDELLLSIKVC